jgi:hypothetical protein
MRPRLFLLALFTIATLSGTAVFGQEPAPPPAHVSFVQGAVTVERSGDSEPAAVNMPIVEGDRIVTGPNGRAEVMFPDGSAIEIDSSSDVEFVGPARVRVIAGTIEHRASPGVDPQSPSSQYLPPDLQPYEQDLDQNGAWRYDPQYGNVWYPTTIAADWRPYYDGYWSSVPAYGWTWIGTPRWAWPTHHYGRWGYARNRWFWMPGPAYSPAWVSWGTAAGYVGWCPLGYDNRAAVALSVGYAPTWNAWTVVHREQFGSRLYAPRRYAVEPSRIAANTAFIEHRTPPARERRGSFSVGSIDGRAAGARAVQRPLPNTPSPIGAAVPRDGSDRQPGAATQEYAGSSRDARAGFERRARALDGRDGVAPAGAVAPVTPTPTLHQSNDADHPAYRRRDAAPGQSAPPTHYREPMNGGDARPGQPVERPIPPQNRPAPQVSSPAPPPPPPATGAPAPRENGAAPPRADSPPSREHSPNSQSTGNAVRRPR